MKTGTKAPGLRIVGGTAFGPTAPIAGSVSRHNTERPCRVIAPPATETARNARLREQRKKNWYRAETATRYWHGLMEWNDTLYLAQRDGIEHALGFHEADHSQRVPLVKQWRQAWAQQLLTPAPDLRAIEWKRAQLRNKRTQHQFDYVSLTPEQARRAIDEDVVFLVAHPVRHNNSEAAQRRREFKEAMRRHQGGRRITRSFRRGDQAGAQAEARGNRALLRAARRQPPMAA